MQIHVACSAWRGYSLQEVTTPAYTRGSTSIWLDGQGFFRFWSVSVNLFRDVIPANFSQKKCLASLASIGIKYHIVSWQVDGYPIRRCWD